MNINQVVIVGNLTRDPELRFTPAGAALANFAVAVNKRWLNKQTDTWDESTSFIDVTVWREQAENVAVSLSKGSRAIVVGELRQRSWETDDGQKRSKVEVTASLVAPSLEWATAIVSRNERKTADPTTDAAPAAAYNDEPY